MQKGDSKIFFEKLFYFVYCSQRKIFNNYEDQKF
jgi:hypothetical protein